MLYDNRWGKDVKTAPFSLESLIAWLEMQPANKEYCYFDRGGCLFHRYLTAMGLDVLQVGGFTYKLRSNPNVDLPLGETFEGIAAIQPHTFGGALDRARAALAVTSNHRGAE